MAIIMNLYLITFSNSHGVIYDYFIYADKVKFNKYGSGVEFIIGKETIRMVATYLSVLKINNDEMFWRIYNSRDFGIGMKCYGSNNKNLIIEEANKIVEHFGYM